GDACAQRRLRLDGCPHACAQHWVADIGFQGTTARDGDGQRGQAYDIYLRGALWRRAALTRPLSRRVQTRELDELVHGLVGGWLTNRAEDESLRVFLDRT